MLCLTCMDSTKAIVDQVLPDAMVIFYPSTERDIEVSIDGAALEDVDEESQEEPKDQDSKEDAVHNLPASGRYPCQTAIEKSHGNLDQANRAVKYYLIDVSPLFKVSFSRNYPKVAKYTDISLDNSLYVLSQMCFPAPV